MIAALGVNIATLYTIVFAIGAALAGFAGAMMGAIQSVQVGMGEPVLILAFVVIVIGGIGSIKGALIGAILVGVVDTLGARNFTRIFQPVYGNLGCQLRGVGPLVHVDLCADGDHLDLQAGRVGEQ